MLVNHVADATDFITECDQVSDGEGCCFELIENGICKFEPRVLLIEIGCRFRCRELNVGIVSQRLNDGEEGDTLMIDFDVVQIVCVLSIGLRDGQGIAVSQWYSGRVARDLDRGNREGETLLAEPRLKSEWKWAELKRERRTVGTLQKKRSNKVGFQILSKELHGVGLGK